MEKAAVMEECAHQKIYSNCASMSVGSYVKIDSISIDLDNVKDKSDAGKCKHFSMRGYVSEIRKKNWKMCWPFTLDSEQDSFEERTSLLPLLNVPKFKWWRCHNCLKEIGSGSTEKDHHPGFNSGRVESKFNNTCCQMPSLGCTAALPPDPQETPGSDIVEKRIVDVCMSHNVSSKMHHPSSCSDKKEEKDEVAATTSGHETCLKDDVSHEIPRLAVVVTEIDSSRMQEKHKYDTGAEALKLESNRFNEFIKQSCGCHESTDFDFPNKNHKCTARNPTTICEREKHASVDELKQKELVMASGTSMSPRLNDEAGNAEEQKKGHGNLVLDECDYASSESFGILAENKLQDRNHDKSSGSHRRKTRKVRLLTELLFDNGDGKSDHIRTEDSSSNGINSGSSAMVEMVPVPQVKASLPENLTGELDDNKKRKLSHDGERRSPQLNFPNNINKKVKNSNGDGKAAAGIADSETGKDISGGSCLQTDMKNYWNKFRTDTSPVIGKKKNKKIQVTIASLPLAQTEEILPKQILDKVGISSKVNVDSGIAPMITQDEFIARGMNQILLPAPIKDRKSSFSKKKNKMPKLNDGQAPWNKKDGPSTRKDVEIIQTGPLAVSYQPVKDASTGKGLHLSLGSYLAEQGYERRYISQVEDGLPSLSPWQEGTSKVDEVMQNDAETSNLANSRVSSKSASFSFLGKDLHVDHSRLPTYGMPALNEKHKYKYQAEEACHSQMQQRDISGTSNCQKTLRVKEHSAVCRKRGDQIADRVSESGALDDIPMEIVELMAKNQYERCLDNAENGKRQLEMTNDARSGQMIDYSKVYGFEKFRILEETSQKQKTHAKNGKNGTTVRKNVGSTKQRSVDYFSHIDENHLNVSHLGHSYAPTGISAFSQSQKKPSSRVQFPATGSSRCSCAQNCRWNGDTGHGFSHTSMQVGACSTCQTISQSSEEPACLWPSMMPNRMPLTYGIPQKGAAQSTSIGMLSHCSNSLHKGTVNRDHDLKFLNLNAASPERPNQKIGSENLGRRNVDYPLSNKHNGIGLHQNLVGSLDLYSNETIPAMHLLSLMDAQRQPGAAFNVGGNSKFLERPCSHDHSSKEYSRLETSIYKASDGKHLSSEYFGKTHRPGKSHDCFFVNPSLGPSTSSFQHDKGLERNTHFTGQVSLSSEKKEKVRSCSPTQSKGRKPQKSMLAHSALGTNHGAISVHNICRGFLDSSGPTVFPLQCQTTENSTQKLETCLTNSTCWPPKSSSESTLCSVNRNPADFSMPEVRNEYMIKGEDLRFGKLIPFEFRPDLINVEQHKRRKHFKHITEKERGRPRIS